MSGPGLAPWRSWFSNRRSLLLTAALFAALLAALTVVYYSRGAAQPAPPLDDFGAAPSFELTDQDGHTVASDSLRGKIVLINFIYTNWQDICPLLTTKMKLVQDQLRGETLLGSDVLLLSITVDPERDSAAVLRAYGEARGADFTSWRFLTGPSATIVPLVVEGFHLGVDVLPPASPAATGSASYEVAHGTRFVLIDRRGHIRRYYPGNDLDSRNVLNDIRTLPR